MSKVVFKQTAYRYKELKPVVFDMLDAIAPDLFAPNRRVLIKPNLLAPAKPEKAVITHPLVVRIVAEYIIKKGARPVIADSPPMGSLEKILKEGGYLKAFRGLDVEFKAFKESVKVDIGEPFGQIDIARDAIEADVVVNLAKLKTHSQMRLTLGVKKSVRLCNRIQKTGMASQGRYRPPFFCQTSRTDIPGGPTDDHACRRHMGTRRAGAWKKRDTPSAGSIGGRPKCCRHRSGHLSYAEP